MLTTTPIAAANTPQWHALRQTGIGAPNAGNMLAAQRSPSDDYEYARESARAG